MNNEETRLFNEENNQTPEMNINPADSTKEQLKKVATNPITTGVAGVVIGAAVTGFTMNATNSPKPVAHKDDDDSDKTAKTDEKSEDKAQDKAEDKAAEGDAKEEKVVAEVKAEDAVEEKAAEGDAKEEKVVAEVKAEGNEKVDDAGVKTITAESNEVVDEKPENEAVVAEKTGMPEIHASTTAEAHAEVAEADAPAVTETPSNIVIASLEEVPFASVEADNFEEAFAQAREQVGPAGAFEFDGKIYATYTADEWNAMPVNEQLAFQSSVMDTYNNAALEELGPDAPVAPKPEEVLMVSTEEIPFLEIDTETFEEAFDIARAEMGPGAAFLYGDKIYATYTPEEWNELSPNQQLAFQNNAMETYNHYIDEQIAEEPAVPEPGEVIVGSIAEVPIVHIEADTFSQAFAEARAMVGPGGAFEYNGKIYGTYYANEWSAMSQAEKNAFQANVNNSLHSDDYHPHVEEDIQAFNEPADHHPYADVHSGGEEIFVEEYEPEIEVMGVESVMTEGGQINVGGLLIDNDPMLLVDVDNDGVFDYGVHDDNYDGQIDADEIHDISDLGITVNDLDPYGDSYTAADDNIDDYNDDIMPA